jgi:predicted secreted protein
VISARELILAHQGEEAVFVAIPVLIIFALLAVSARRRDEEEDDVDDEDDS